MECVMCKKAVNIFSPRLADGRICKNCRAFIPAGIRLRSTESFYVKDIYEKNKEKAAKFDATANLGSLYLDSVHNLFCISRGQKNGNPTEYGNIFHVLELTGIGLVCTNVENTALKSGQSGANVRDNIVCDVKLTIKTNEVQADYIVKSKVRCSFTYNGNKIEWNEPGEIQVFRKMFLQMFDNICGELTQKIEQMKELQDQIPTDEKWARGILYLSSKDELTAEMLKKSRNRLIKVFHPDNGFEDSSYSEMVNQAYKILSEKI